MSSKKSTGKVVALLDLNGCLVHNNRSLGSGNLPANYGGGDPSELKRAFDNGHLPKAYYLTSAEEIVWMDGVLDALKALHEEGILCIVITNQEHINSGITHEEDWRHVIKAMDRDVEAAGGKISDWYWCPHAPSETCDCHKRKDNPGIALFQRAALRWGFDLADAVMVGDNPTDVYSGNAAGCTTIHIPLPMVADADKVAPSDLVCKSFPGAAEIIIKMNKLRVGSQES